jgi:hypothetical protein
MPLWQQRMTCCLHFNGFYQHEECRAGVNYTTVKDETVSPFGYPCFKDRPCSTTCTKAEFMTEAQAKQSEAETLERLAERRRKLDANICPVCDQPMTKRQVGPCVYAQPCGHRLYQGRLT